MSDTLTISSQDALIRDGFPEIVLAAGIFVPRHDNAGLRLRTTDLPERIIVTVTDEAVYCFSSTYRGVHLVPDRLLVRMDRETTAVQIHHGLRFRVIELTDSNTGSEIALEGRRMAAHTGCVISALRARVLRTQPLASV